MNRFRLVVGRGISIRLPAVSGGGRGLGWREVCSMDNALYISAIIVEWVSKISTLNSSRRPPVLVTDYALIGCVLSMRSVDVTVSKQSVEVCPSR